MSLEKKEIDHEYTDEIVCPHCGHRYDNSYEYANDGEGEIDCEDCEGKFNYIADVSVNYTTSKKL